MSAKKKKYKAKEAKSARRLSSPPAGGAGIVSGQRRKTLSLPKKLSIRILMAAAVVIVCAAVIWAIIFLAGRGGSSPDTSGVVDGGSIKISNVDISKITEKTITVTWKTNVPSSSQVIATEQESGLVIAGWPDDELLKDHKYEVAGLEPDTAYQLTIKAVDVEGSGVELKLQEQVATMPVRTSTDLVQGMKAPQFALKTLAGKDVSLADSGGKQIILVFWEMSCASCKEQLPLIQEFFSLMDSNEYILLTVCVKGRQALVESYAAGSKFTFPILLDEEGAVAEKYTIAVYPTTILIDGEGIIISVREASFGSVDEMTGFVASDSNARSE